MTQAPKLTSQWIAPATLPTPLQTPRFLLEPLGEHHADLDFAALMSCRTRLNKELQWGTWPPAEFTLEDNRGDLARHHGEFERGEAFAYTVLHPDRSRCLGCIYIERCDEIDGAQLAFWVIDEALELEPDLVRNVLDWIHTTWPIDRVLIPFREANSRGISLMNQWELVGHESDPGGPLSEHVCFLSQQETR